MTIAVTAFLGILAALFLSAPYMAPPGTFLGLDGSPMIIDNGWLGHGPAGLAYLIGDILCHQETARSFVLNGSQLPVCIRDTGILLGSLAGCAASCFFLDRLRGRKVLIAGVVLLLVTAVQWALQGTVGDNEAIRFASGIVSGIGASVILGWWIVGLTNNDSETELA